jgi:hypothetical protein
MHKRFLRRRYIVDWKLQGSLCMHGLLYGSLILVAVSCGIFVPLLWNLGGSANLPQIEEQAIVMLYMHERFWALAALCIGIVVLGAIKFSHRIAGPLVRYKRNLRLLAEGKISPPLRTRRGDYLQEEVACLNQAMAGVAARVEAIQKANAAIRRELQGVLARTPRQSQSQLEGLVEAGRALEAAVGAFAAIDSGDDRLPEAAVELTPALVGADAGGGA